MIRRRWLAMAVSIGSAFALLAPAAQAAVDETLTFGTDTVRVVDTGPSSDTVRFTMSVAAPATTRLFVDIKGKGEGYITLGTPAALGVAHAVYNTVSIPGCQVYTGTTFGEADEVTTTDGTIAFDIRKDELAPTISLLMENSAGGAPDCKGFDGVSNGRPVSFANGGQIVAGLDWVAPASPTNLTAVGTPGAITLFWTPPANAIGVRYQVVEDGVATPVSESVTGNAATFSNLTPGSVHTYHLWAYRFWGERLFAPAGLTPGATAVAAAFPVPAAVGGAASGALAVKGATTTNGAARKKAAARAFTLKSFRVRATGGRVRIALPKLAKGQKIEIQRSAATKRAKFGRIATSKARSYTDRKVRRRQTYRYRLILVGKDGTRSLPSATLKVRLR